MAANTAVTSLLGMGFWIMAARIYSRVVVGRDAALISAMVELSTFCQLNLGNGILRFLPGLGTRTRRALIGAYTITGAMAIAAGATFVLLAPSLSKRMIFLEEEPALRYTFVIALLLWGIFALQDAALTATRRAPWVPVENGLFGVLKLMALPALAVLGIRHGVFAAWVLPMALLVLPVNVLLFRHAIPGHLASQAHAFSPMRLPLRGAVRFLSQDYLASIFTQATLTVVPLLVLATLGAAASAYFAIPFMIVMAFDTAAYGACTSLVVEGALHGEELRALTRVFMRRVLTLIMPAGALLIVAAPLVMLPFGHAYAQHGTAVLRLLGCASLLRMVIALFSAVARVQQRGLWLASVELGLLGLVLAPSVALGHAYGIDGVALAWLLANAFMSLVVAVWLWRFLGGSDSRTETATAK
jgi:hypothetical protein